MKKSRQQLASALPEQTPKFIHLKGKTFAEYNIIYHINDSYSIEKLSNIKDKHQLFFQKFEDKIQQLNLTLCDDFLPAALADVAIHTLIGKASSFKEYIHLNRFFVAVDSETDKIYFRNKFNRFIHHLLYSNIASSSMWNGELEYDRVYYQKSSSSEIDYYPVAKQNQLQESFLQKMRLEINLKNSSITKQKVTLNLKIFTP